jgi:hypothetical protein
MENFFKYIEKEIPNSIEQDFNFCKISNRYDRTNDVLNSPAHRIQQLRIVIDIEHCLDRIYGGDRIDWISGGHWMNFYQFHQCIVSLARKHNIQIIYYLNGTVPKSGHVQTWTDRQQKIQQKIQKIYHIIRSSNKKNGFISNELWIPPIHLKQTLIDSIKLDALNCSKHQVFVYASLKNHAKELVQFCKINNCHDLLTNDMEVLAYICTHDMINKMNLYSAKSLTIGRSDERITAHRYNLQEIFKALSMDVNEFATFTAILGAKYGGLEKFWFTDFFKRLENIYTNDNVRALN